MGRLWQILLRPLGVNIESWYLLTWIKLRGTFVLLENYNGLDPKKTNKKRNHWSEEYNRASKGQIVVLKEIKGSPIE